MCTEQVLPFVVRIIRYSFFVQAEQAYPSVTGFFCNVAFLHEDALYFTGAFLDAFTFRFLTSRRLFMAALALFDLQGSLRRGRFVAVGQKLWRKNRFCRH